MRLLWFNLATDESNSMLAFGVRWLEAVAAHVDAIDVVTMTAGPYHLPPNVRVHSLGKEHGASEPRRALTFYRTLLHLLRTHRYDGCFSHMNPLFSVMASPLLALWRVPVTTWYAHPRCTRMVRLAHRVSRHMVASVPAAYPYRHDAKFIAIGQGIDTEVFAPQPVAPDVPPLVLCVSRLSPVKGQHLLLEAAARLRTRGVGPFTLAFVGEDIDPDYARSLRARTEALGLGGLVQFHPPARLEALPAVYARCTVHVNLTPTGFGDKVAWEAMACGRPCLYSNEGYHDTAGPARDALYVPHGDVDALTDRLEAVLALPAEARDALGATCRAGVVRLHSLQKLARRIVSVTVPEAQP